MANYSSLFPPYAALVSQTNANYNIAISYYSQRRVMFEKALSAGSINIYEQFKNALSEKARIFNEIVLRKAMSAITAGKYTTEQRQADGEYSVEIAKIFNARYFNSKTGEYKLNVYQLGKQFEEFMTNNAVSTAQLQKVQAFIEANTQQLLQQVGTVQQQAWSVGGRTAETRTDLAISKNGQIGQMELVSALDLEEKPPAGVDPAQFILDAVVAAGVDTNVFGFQLKTYASEKDDKRWQNAEAIMHQITEIFNSAQLHTWSSNYVVNYPTWYLSKYLINIINPVNVANITLNGLEFMDDWLSHIRLYMETTWERSTGRGASAARGGGVEVVHPSVATKHILIRSIKKGNQERTMFKGFSNTGSTRWAAYEKSVRVASIKNI